MVYYYVFLILNESSLHISYHISNPFNNHTDVERILENAFKCVNATHISTARFTPKPFIVIHWLHILILNIRLPEKNEEAARKCFQTNTLLKVKSGTSL